MVVSMLSCHIDCIRITRHYPKRPTVPIGPPEIVGRGVLDLLGPGVHMDHDLCLLPNLTDHLRDAVEPHSFAARPLGLRVENPSSSPVWRGHQLKLDECWSDRKKPILAPFLQRGRDSEAGLAALEVYSEFLVVIPG